MSEQVSPKLFTPGEVDTLILATAYGQGSATQADFERVLAWAMDARITAGLLQAVLAGELKIGVRSDGELEFSATPKGQARAAELAVRPRKR